MKIGVVLPIGEDDETGQPPAYTEVRGMALAAEAAGFDSLWLPDHLRFRLPDRSAFGVWECWSILTALAEAMERVELGTLVLSVPVRNPAPAGEDGGHDRRSFGWTSDPRAWRRLARAGIRGVRHVLRAPGRAG